MSAGGIAGKGMSGAAAGSTFGPHGAAIGGAAGIITGILQAKAEKEEMERQEKIRSQNQMANVIGTGTKRQSDILGDRQRAQQDILSRLMR